MVVRDAAEPRTGEIREEGAVGSLVCGAGARCASAGAGCGGGAGGGTGRGGVEGRLRGLGEEVGQNGCGEWVLVAVFAAFRGVGELVWVLGLVRVVRVRVLVGMGREGRCERGETLVRDRESCGGEVGRYRGGEGRVGQRVAGQDLWGEGRWKGEFRGARERHTSSLVLDLRSLGLGSFFSGRFESLTSSALSPSPSPSPSSSS